MALPARHPLIGSLELQLPAWTGSRPTEPTPFDGSVAPGATELLVVAFEGEGARLEARCMGLPDAFWIDGFERPLLDAASAVTRRALQLPTVTPGPIEGAGPFTQHLRGDGASARHWLGFAEDRVVLCTAVCRGDGEAWLDAATMTGSAGPPPPSWWVAGATAAAGSPRVTVLAGLAVVLLVVAAVLRQRPRPSSF